MKVYTKIVWHDMLGMTIKGYYMFWHPGVSYGTIFEGAWLPALRKGGERKQGPRRNQRGDSLGIARPEPQHTGGDLR